MRTKEPGDWPSPGPRVVHASRPAERSAASRRRLSDWPELPFTDHQLIGAEAAARHLMAHGLMPIFATTTIRALWRRGDRELAETLAKIRGAL